MARTEVAEIGLLRPSTEGSIAESDSLWLVFLSALGREDANNIKEKFEITNAWFPFPKHTLRRLLDSRGHESTFAEWQQDLLHHAHWPQAGLSQYVHVALEDADDVIEVDRPVGHGAYGYVEQVTISTVTKPVICVRKKIQRPRAIHAQQKHFSALLKEISVMRQVAHRHCVQLLGSYTDHDFMGILLLPVADMNLATFLDLPDLSDAKLQFLRQSIGCLYSALNYLHRKMIR
jgi:hypothetical protein